MVVNEDKELLYDYLVNGNRNAYETLFLKYMYLVKATIYRVVKSSYKTVQELEEEFFSVGCIGLHKAINSFDLDKIDFVLFKTHAINLIKNEIYNEIKYQNKSVHPSVSLDEPIIAGEIKETFGNVIEDKENNIRSYQDEDFANYKKVKIESVLSDLSERDRKILELYYGLNGYSQMTYREIAEIYNVTTSEIGRLVRGLNKYLAERLSEFKDLYTRKDISLEKKESYNPVDKTVLKEKREKMWNGLIDGYGDNNVKLAFDALNGEERKFLRSYFGVYGGEIKSKEELIREYGEFMARTGSLYLISKLNNCIVSSGIEVSAARWQLSKKLDRYINKHGLNWVIDVIEKMSIKDKVVFYSFFGLNGYLKEEDVKIYKKVPGVNISSSISLSFSVLEKVSNNPSHKFEEKKYFEKYRELIEFYGESQVNEAIMELSGKEKDLFKSCIDNASLDNVTAYNKIGILLVDEIEKILIYKNTVQDKKMGKINILIVRYGYERVINEINKLTERDRDILMLYYGIEGHDIKSEDELKMIFKLTNISRKLNELIEDIEYSLKMNGLNESKQIKKIKR